VRACAWCGGSLEGKRSHAVYCDRSCKTKASDRRRIEDGRGIERDRARYEREAEVRKAYAMKYLAENSEKMRAIRRNRKSRIKAQRFEFTDRDWRRMCERARHRCVYCGEKRELTRDHVIPVVRGGRHSVGNIVPACAPCNYRKKIKLLSEWRYSRGGESHPIPTRARGAAVQSRAELHRTRLAS
jgi:5-methylcytosine-specific restriction endonuclease McrA